MKIQIHFLAAVSMIMLFAGCASIQKEKLPAGDIDIYTLYANEIETLHNPALRTDSKLKYDAAMTLYKNVDFSFVRDTKTLEKIFGGRDAHLGKRKFEEQDIIYVYRHNGKRLRFVFVRYNNAIIHSECTDQIN